MLQVNNISKSYGTTHAVRQLNLHVEMGQIRGLLGPNGAGKTTTIRMICGVLAPSSGSVLINDMDVSKHPSKTKEILGYVPEGAPLPLELLPMEYLRHTARMYGLTSAQAVEMIDYWADRCDIKDVLRKPIGSLSRGFRQRVALASSLLHKPALLVLDEPSTGLDPEQSASFRELLRELSRTTAIIYSSHHLAEVEVTCDVISIIHQGKLLLDGDFTSLRSGAQSMKVEVSPHEIVTQIKGHGFYSIDETWASCTVDEVDGEQIVSTVSSLGGKIRLLQPSVSSLESNYLRIIHDAEQSE
jgi:ABC-2 type transport system ATP-binding protein